LYLKPHGLCMACWDERARGWHPDTDICHSFDMTFKKIRHSIGP
jgi:hypothetical protein